ncbi:MAG: Ppx/GppA phosphatase family protein [Caulobacteraceae bacterium]
MDERISSKLRRNTEVRSISNVCEPPRAAPGGPAFPSEEILAALDLGTNNCRLLIVRRQEGGWKTVGSHSEIVRLGEGLSTSGVLSEAAMKRALSALDVCAAKIGARRADRVRAVATQACRAAANGADFLARVERETGLKLEIITPAEEARLAVQGCLELADPLAEAVLVLDIGGGSTELSWVSPGRPGSESPIVAWLSAPLGVVSLAERCPEPLGGGEAWRSAMRAEFRREMEAFKGAASLRAAFLAGRAHLIGTSGAITSLAALHLDLRRYQRSQVDGLWMTSPQWRAAAARVADMSPDERAKSPCIGKGRADLVLAGAAILEAVQELWPTERVRVADRGLREGMLLEMMGAESSWTSR